MKKILLIGRLNKTVQELYDSLSRRFQVQLSTEMLGVVKGMLPIIRPDMVIISVMELEDVDNEVFDLLRADCPGVPVIVAGTKEGCEKYQKYYDNVQFVQVVRPFSKEWFVDECYRILNIGGSSEGNAAISIEEEQKPKQILVVDDSPVTLRGIKAMLDKKYQVSVATSGEQALRFIAKSHPDLILLDYEMPGWDGKETLERIRADVETKSIPVMFLTGVADKEHIAAVLGLNPAGYFLKPPEKEKLIKAIEDIFEKRKQGQGIWDIDIQA